MMSNLFDFLSPLACLCIHQLSRSRLPQTQGTLTLPGLAERVEVIRDRWGIPHIYAANAHDLFFAQGFVHAQDRLWQMELNRRIAQGRLSELFGELSLDADRAVRTFGFNRLGQADWENGCDGEREVVQAYAEGVNAYLNHPRCKLPVEFTLLNHRPELWQPQDTIAFMRVMIWQLSHAWYDEIVRARVAQKVGAQRAAELEIRYPDQNPTTLPDGIDFNHLSTSEILEQEFGPFLSRGQGSNEWVVSGHKSATGQAFLCNDMHLSLTLPAIWYEMHLSGGDFNITGVTLPGVPLVLVGHNARIAWGMTLAFTDCEDLFVEQVDPQAPQRYQFNGEWRDALVIEEPIRVKGRPAPHIEKVLITHHGPIISDVIGYAEQRIAVQSMALRPCPAYRGWLNLNQAKNWDDFVEAMAFIEAPQLNVVYGDVDGNTGYWVTGKVPIRAKGDGSVPSPGWSGEYEWTGEVPFEEMPHALNPKAGYLINCNNRIVPDDYPYFLGKVWMNGYRAQRIGALFAGKEKLSVEDFRAAQMDCTCIPGQEFAARLQGMSSPDPDIDLALKRLQAWDGRLSTDSLGGALYEVTRFHLVRNLLEPGLGPELAMKVMGVGFHPLLKGGNEFFGHDTVTALRLLDDPDSEWVEEAGGREAVLNRSLKQAVEWLRGELGADPDGWQWGKIHTMNFMHLLGLQKPLDRVFNLGPFPIGGDTDTPCQTAMYPAAPYDSRACAPSFRQIVDLGDLSRSVAMYPPGQSGQVGSPHYADLVEPWLNGEYHPMLWTREQVEKEAEARLVLRGE